ncbi:hypothetical protein L207DRAFT_577804 [Hyaloscypha variabilis F]|uniref:Uncharacterized protein n=1 Tax=Hyaloscypha variabilis (strain UAMH 11265 / GT02V1 / F) TaxID=1149755 RepID=A0A2J6S261_HYAVF|nr:hypothetical protein L207DRAFT_577804 [Hyaloscypha variabilis F]
MALTMLSQGLQIPEPRCERFLTILVYDFDIEWDFNRRIFLDCLTTDTNIFDLWSPKSVKSVGDIFEDPNSASIGLHQTIFVMAALEVGGCWLIAAPGAMGNQPRLIQRVCVTRNGGRWYIWLVLRDSEWKSKIIDHKSYSRI